MENNPFSVKKYMVIFMVGFYMSVVLYFIPYISYLNGIVSNQGRVIKLLILLG